MNSIKSITRVLNLFLKKTLAEPSEVELGGLQGQGLSKEIVFHPLSFNKLYFSFKNKKKLNFAPIIFFSYNLALTN